ncbi:hypothetical protein E3E36_01805 [Thermococcus sp. M36]|uniref:hypothetical protein n=1 Tax=Thermococcus sp. M36 TaxID=1638261 RepID=UPI00143BC064|nr:hypothetical protein [Thermococcus sp. M36]NJE04904.1 hypothetical protein [Thermococcus sp. M36]
MRRVVGLIISILVFGLVLQPALATKDAIQQTTAGIRVYEIEIYGVPVKLVIADNSSLNTPEEVKAFIESHISPEEFVDGSAINVKSATSTQGWSNEHPLLLSMKSMGTAMSTGTSVFVPSAMAVMFIPVFVVGEWVLTALYALLAMAVVMFSIEVAEAIYEYSDEIREKLDSAYQYFYNYIEERKKDEKTIHIYEKDFYGGLPKRIYVKEFVHKKDFRVTVGELVGVIVEVPSGKLALNATVKNLKEGNWELAALKGIRFIIGATGEAVAYLAIIKPEAYGPSTIDITPRSNAKGPDFVYVKSTKIPSDLTKWEAKGTTVFRVTSLIRDGYYRNLEGQPGIVSVYRMYKSNLYVAFIHA